MQSIAEAVVEYTLIKKIHVALGETILEITKDADQTMLSIVTAQTHAVIMLSNTTMQAIIDHWEG